MIDKVGLTQDVAKTLMDAAVRDGAFTSSDGAGTITAKTFSNIFGRAASTFEQNAWTNAVNQGWVTKEMLPFAMFTSYLGANNVPDSYKIPGQSRIIAVESFTNYLNGPAGDALGKIGAANAAAARAWLLPIQTQADAAVKAVGVASSVASIAGTAGVLSNDVGVYNPNPYYGIVGTMPLTLS